MTRPPTEVTFPTHPVVLLEPTVHIALGAALLGWWDLRTGVGTSLGIIFILLGFAFGVPAVRRYWKGAFTVTGETLRLDEGVLAHRPVTIRRPEVVDLRVRPGARRLRYDPLHRLLGLVSHYGSIEMVTSADRTHVLNPVALHHARAAIETWRTGPKAVAVAKHVTWPLHLLLAAGTLACGLAAASNLENALHSNVLFGSAALLELSFWCSLGAAYFRRRD